MKTALDKYASKMADQRLADRENILFLSVDDEIYSNAGASHESPLLSSLGDVFNLMNISSLLYVVPNEPVQGIIGSILDLESNSSAIIPQDCETRTFFHDIPVIVSEEPGIIARALSRRKAAIIRKPGSPVAIISYGTVSPEQAFVSFSSTCFSTFVKYFYDYLMYLERCREKGIVPDTDRITQFERVGNPVLTGIEGAAVSRSLASGSAETGEALDEMIVEAGRRLVGDGLVDSFFGNISARFGNTVHVSETAASLDELDGVIDAVPLDGSSSVGITSSSEYSTHRAVYQTTGSNFILHGHPKFSVIMSMICLKDCELRGQCHRACREERDLFGVPIVPGEIGTGPNGIVNTVPKALAKSDTVIVFGHGVFATGEKDFNSPYLRMRQIEESCRREYFRRTSERVKEFKI